MSQRDTWNVGYGSRHYADIAPFSLWDGISSTFRLPAVDESQWIFQTFGAVSINFFWPRIIIETATPPRPVPLTVACVAAIFIPVGSRCPPLATNTDYSNPRMADPIPTQFHWLKWNRPTKEQCRAVWERLGQVMNIEAINFIPPTVIIELRHDERVYGKRSLPGKVAGRIAVYHHGPTSFWETIPRTRDRMIRPSGSVQGMYSQTHKSRRLLQSTDISDNAWCTLYGMDNKVIYLRTDGVRLQRAQHLPLSEFLTANIIEYIGPEGTQVERGACGAPIVIDDDNDVRGVGVLGFFQLGRHGSRWVLSPVVDDFDRTSLGFGVKSCM